MCLAIIIIIKKKKKKEKRTDIQSTTDHGYDLLLLTWWLKY